MIRYRIAIIIICFSLFCSFLTFGENKRKQKQTKAFEDIQLLKDGVILVRLRSKSHTIDALLRVGKVELAEKVRHRQEVKNSKIVSGFQNEYDFSKVLFFYSEYSKNILAGEYNCLMEVEDDSLQEKLCYNLDTNRLFIAEFGNIEAADNTNITLGALRIMDSKLTQLEDPFPYYSRTYDSTRSIHKVVSKMNTKLWKFYLKSMRKYPNQP